MEEKYRLRIYLDRPTMNNDTAGFLFLDLFIIIYPLCDTRLATFESILSKLTLRYGV